MKAAIITALLVLGAACPAAAAGVEAVKPWSRPAAAGANGVGYVTLVNKGAADALVGVDTPAAQSVQMHVSSMAGGVMRMAQEARTPIPAGGSVAFAPGGRHLMLIGLKQALHAGDRIPATLRFASGARLKVEFQVNAGAAPAMDHMSGHMDMH